MILLVPEVWRDGTTVLREDPALVRSHGVRLLTAGAFFVNVRDGFNEENEAAAPSMVC